MVPSMGLAASRGWLDVWLHYEEARVVKLIVAVKACPSLPLVVSICRIIWQWMTRQRRARFELIRRSAIFFTVLRCCHAAAAATRLILPTHWRAKSIGVSVSWS
jgi:hypothetical protein